MFAIAYDRLKCGMWIPYNISVNYPVSQYSYLFVGGPAGRKGYFAPVEKALQSYGVPTRAINRVAIDYTATTLRSARKLFKAVNYTYSVAMNEQPVVLVVHSQAMVPVHAYLSLFPEAGQQVHAVIAYNPIWAGSVLADNVNGLPDAVAAVAKSNGITAATVKDITYASRKEMVRSFPLDFNSFRVLVAGTSVVQSKDYAASIPYLRRYSKSINDGVLALEDQLIPGARAVLLDKVDHDDLVYPSAATAAYNSTIAAQAMLYTLFKLSP